MKSAVLFCLLLAGCTSFDDHQFCTLLTHENGMTRCHAWLIGPSNEQSERFERGAR